MLASIIVWAGGAAAWGQGTGREFSVEAMRAETRVALVIGDGTYDGSPLRNPVSDACAMARALRELRFEITAIENATQREMRLSIIRFGDRLRGGGVGRFFFAGHRGQVGGKNFMIRSARRFRRSASFEHDSLPDGEVKVFEKAIAEASRSWSDAQRRSIWYETDSGVTDDDDDDSLCGTPFSGIGKRATGRDAPRSDLGGVAGRRGAEEGGGEETWAKAGRQVGSHRHGQEKATR